MNFDETGLAIVLRTAQDLCRDDGGATIDAVAAQTTFDRDTVKAALTDLVRRGALIVRPGGIYARPRLRHAELPGENYITTLQKLTASALMVARA